MADMTLVLNAGSSSLKFCVYKQEDGLDWRIERPVPAGSLAPER